MTFQIDTYIRWFDENGCHVEKENEGLVSIHDPYAADAYIANLAAQADDTYFDGVIRFSINEETFYGGVFGTSALIMTWEHLVRFKENERQGRAEVTFLDLPLEFYILFHKKGCQLKTFHEDYEVDENNRILESVKTAVLSEIIPRGVFEQEIMRACGEFIDFCERHRLPVNAEEAESLKEYYDALAGNPGA